MLPECNRFGHRCCDHRTSGDQVFLQLQRRNRSGEVVHEVWDEQHVEPFHERRELGVRDASREVNVRAALERRRFGRDRPREHERNVGARLRHRGDQHRVAALVEEPEIAGPRLAYVGEARVLGGRLRGEVGNVHAVREQMQRPRLHGELAIQSL